LAKPITKVGLQLYSLREQIPNDVKGVIAKVAKAGYKEVETYGFSKDKGFFGLRPKEFKALLDSHNLYSPSGHYGIDQFLKEGKTDDLNVTIDAVKVLGSKYLTVPYLGEEYRKTADDCKRLAEKFNKAGEICRKAGIKFAYHNHDFEFKPVEGVSLYDVLLKNTNPSLVKFEADLYWVVRAKQDPISMFKKHSGRFVMFHIKDMDKTNPGLNTEVGNGAIDFKKIYAHAATAGVEHIFVEQENFTKIDPFVSITKSANYVKSNLLK
jgi:sugar phosphate isomerase/epimerase